MQLSAFLEELTVFLEEADMRETALRMALLRPGITEIDVEAVYLARCKDILDVIDVKDQQANILEFLFRDLLRAEYRTSCCISMPM